MREGTMTSLMAVGAVLLAVLACGTGSSGSGPAGSAGAASAKVKPAKAKKWSKSYTADCPTHINTAKIEMEDIDGGYAVVVTSTDKSDAKRIQTHAEYMAGASEHSKPPEDALKLGGVTGNRNNNCPIILSDKTKITASSIDGGARVEVRAKDEKELAALRKRAQTTLKNLGELKAALKKSL